MAKCVVSYSVVDFDGDNDAINIYYLEYRPSGVGQVTSDGGLYSDTWVDLPAGGAASARTVSLLQGDLYDFRFAQGRKQWNNCTCPSSDTADLQDLLATAS